MQKTLTRETYKSMPISVTIRSWFYYIIKYSYLQFNGSHFIDTFSLETIHLWEKNLHFNHNFDAKVVYRWMFSYCVEIVIHYLFKAIQSWFRLCIFEACTLHMHMHNVHEMVHIDLGRLVVEAKLGHRIYYFFNNNVQSIGACGVRLVDLVVFPTIYAVNNGHAKTAQTCYIMRCWKNDVKQTFDWFYGSFWMQNQRQSLVVKWK